MSEAGPLETAPLVSIVIVTYNALEYARRGISDVLSRTRTPFELILIDNASQEETREYLRSLSDPRLRVIFNDENRLWCAGVNQGMKAADSRSKYTLLLNPDIEIQRDDWLEVMLHAMESDPRVGIVGPTRCIMPDGPMFGWIDGVCMLIRRELHEQIGYFDEERWPWAGAPMEFAVAAYSKGWIYKVVNPSDVILKHHGGRSIDSETKPVIKECPRPRPAYREILQKYGIRPTASFAESRAIPRQLRPTVKRLAEPLRFYYSRPVGAAPPPARP